MNKEEKLMLRELYLSANADQRLILEKFYPKLKESEGEKIRKALISEIKIMNANYSLFSDVPKDRFIAWLEKQGEQKDIVNNQSDYVDLGLPSGTLWAKCNLGAEKETDFGYFYQWGNINGYKGVDEHRFDRDNYKYGSWMNFTKYNENDTKLILDNEDDPVFVATNGEQKMPTKEQLQELIAYTNHEWTTIDGVKGMRFVNKNDGTKYIFIPGAGHCFDGSHGGVGSWGYVWSASRNESYASSAWVMYFEEEEVEMYYSSRCYGRSVRGVLNK